MYQKQLFFDYSLVSCASRQHPNPCEKEVLGGERARHFVRISRWFENSVAEALSGVYCSRNDSASDFLLHARTGSFKANCDVIRCISAVKVHGMQFLYDFLPRIRRKLNLSLEGVGSGVWTENWRC